MRDPNCNTHTQSHVALSKIRAVIIVIILVVAAVVGLFYVTSAPPAASISVASSTSVGSAGTPVSFSVIPSVAQATVTSVTWNFGDGTNATVSGPSTSHTYSNGGSYLVLAQATLSQQNPLGAALVRVVSNTGALFRLQVQPSLSLDVSSKAAVPTINYALDKNPHAPLLSVGETLSPVGGFLQTPSDSSWTLQKYTWNFGNGQMKVVQANSTGDGLPLSSATAIYSNSGIYPVSLTLTTNSSQASFSVTTVNTVAVSSSSVQFSIVGSSLGITNPNVITSVEVTPGGPFSLDPAIGADIISLEVEANLYQTVVFYNGSSTTSFLPVLAAQLPSRQNGGISSDYTTYNFTIRNDQYFSNGDQVNAYDVWFSFARGMAFVGGSPGTNNWIPDQYLVPGVQNGTANLYTDNSWSAMTSSLRYNNKTNTVAFHFNRPMQPAVVFQVLSAPTSASVVDAKYAVSVGAGFSESSWDSFKNQGNEGDYNVQLQWSPIGSGPYSVGTFVPGQSIELVPNPHYGGVLGIPKVSKTVIIDWVKSPDIALLMLKDGQADTVTHLPPSDFPSVQQLQSQGTVKIYNFPSQGTYQYNFNILINKQLEASQFGSSYNEPSNYFSDLPTRYAWINAWNYDGFINNILGNQKYGTTFGQKYVGAIPPGMIYYVPPSELGGLPSQNLQAAQANFSRSAWHDMKITIPVVVLTGDPVSLAGVEEWAQTLNQISGGNLTAVPVQIPFSQFFGDMVPGQDPMPVDWDNYVPDYPNPVDAVSILYQQGGFDPNGMNWFVSNFTSLPPSNVANLVRINGSSYTQGQVYSWLNGNASLAATSQDPAVIARSYKITEVLAVKLGLFVYYYLQESFLYWRSWLGGSETQTSPMFGANGVLLYYWITKG